MSRPVRLYDVASPREDSMVYRPEFMYEPDSPVMMYNAENANQTTEYNRTVEVSRAPDTFVCGHVLCHNCIRRHMQRRFTSTLRCPVCYQRVDILIPQKATNVVAYEEEAPATPDISLLTNFDEIVKKFNGVNNNLRRLKNESVQSRSLGMTYTNTHCDMCNENHGTLKVIQEFNQLALSHERPTRLNSYFYRLDQGRIVTTFYSQVNSACICVPCSYKELRENRKFPELEYITDVEAETKPHTCLAEVGKLIAKNAAPVMSLQGKNVIEIDHKIRVRERADRYNFFETTEQIEKSVKQQEQNLLQMATKQIRDTGRLYHIQESNEIEYDMGETTV